MRLQALLADWLDFSPSGDKDIQGITLHSQQVQWGGLFIATKGGSRDGRHFIEEAIARGAAAILCDEEGSETFAPAAWGPIPIIRLPNLSSRVEDIAIRFYGDPSASLKMSGVTGTNGKTTSTFLLAHAQTYLGIPTAVLGTLGYGVVGDLKPTDLTTPDPISLQKYLADIKAQGMQAVAMEVSSHGLEQNRVKSIRFETALFTNLTPDHLDYHQTMEAYGKAKQKLFQVPSLRRVVINADSDYAQTIVPAVRHDVPIVLYTRNATPLKSLGRDRDITWITVEEFSQGPKGMVVSLKACGEKAVLRSSLLGEFNLSNLLGVIGELYLQGVSLAQACEALSLASPPPGRMQRIGGVRDPVIIIDYAHTPDALENALKAAKLHCKRRLWCVFGCGGERDKDKRKLMGHIAGQWADKIIVTNDNPRNERPRVIIDNILEGFSIATMEKVVVEEDRAKAIEYALSQALPVDTILIAGKGHENYQLMEGKKLPFSDAVCVENWLKKGIIS